MKKIKEIKDNALINISVNKTFYLMVKSLSFYLFKSVEVEDKDAYLKELLTKEFKELNELQRSIYTTILLIVEIEKNAQETDQMEEKDIDFNKENTKQG